MGLYSTSLSIADHLIEGARILPSPNCSERSDPGNISLLVIHNISLPPGEFGTGCIDQLFTNCLDPSSHPYFAEISSLQVSAHLLIDRAGLITQYVPFDLKAWHAGESCFQGQDNCNEFSIGIELEGTDEQPFADAQYDTLLQVTAALLGAYPGLTTERIVGHSDIAPGRKTDPGPYFDWAKYRDSLNGTRTT